MEVIETSLRIVVISTVTQGVGAGHAAGLRENIAPCVVGIGSVDRFRQANEIPVGVPRRQGAEDFNHVALLVQRIEVCYVAAAIIGGILDCKGAALCIVGEDHDLSRAAAADLLINDLAVQRAVLVRDAAHLFIGANAVGVVSVGRRPAAGRDLRELPPVFPRQAGVGRPVIPVFGVAACVVGDRRAADLGQQVAPLGVAIGVGLNGRAVFLHALEVPGCVVVVCIRDRRTGRIGIAAVRIARLRPELVLPVIGIANLCAARRAAGGQFGFLKLRDVAKRVIDVAVARDQAAVRHTVVKILRPGGGLSAGRVIRPRDGEQRAAAVRDGGLLQPPQRIIGEMQRLRRRCSEGGHAAVGGIVVGIIFRVGLAAERPRLPRQAVIAVVDVLRALHRAAVGVQLRAADQAAKGIVLEAVTRKLTRRIAVAQARKRAFCVVGIGNVTTAIIRLPDQSVKPVIGIADGIAVGVGRGFQVAAARGVVVDIIIIGIGGKGAAADLGRGGLTPDIIGKVIILVLRRTAAVGLAVELRQTPAGIGVADRRNARLIGALGAAAAEVVFIGRLPPGRVRRRREQLRLTVIGIGRRAAVGVRDGGRVVAVGRRGRAALQGKGDISIGILADQPRAGRVAGFVIGRRGRQRADGGLGHVVGIVVLIAVLRAVGGGVLQQVDAVGIILRVLRARSGLRRGGHVALLVIAIGLHRLLPQGDVIKPSRTRVVVVGAVNMDVFHRFAASLWHDCA